MMKKIMSLTMVALLVVVALVGCNTAKDVESKETVPKETIVNDVETEEPEVIEETEIGGLGGNVEIANPFTDYETIDEAVAHIDFEVKLPTNIPEGYELEWARVIENELLELIYVKGDSEITYRQGKGTEDISGDYEVYDNVSSQKINDNDVMFSEKNSKINLAVWTDGTYSYSFSINIGEEGLNQETVVSLVEGVE